MKKNKFMLAIMYVIASMAASIFGIVSMDWLIDHLGHKERIEMVFATGGVILACILLLRLMVMTMPDDMF